MTCHVVCGYTIIPKTQYNILCSLYILISKQYLILSAINHYKLDTYLI